MPEQPRNPFEGFRVEVDPDQVQETLRTLRRRVSETVQASRHTRVRLSFRGQRLGPDIPLAVFLAGEGAAFFFLSPLTALLVNLGAKAVLDVEFVHDADERIQEGLDHYLAGDLDLAEKAYKQALRKRPDDPSALYHLATLAKVRGDLETARRHLRAAAMGPEGHPDVVRASEALARMDPA